MEKEYLTLTELAKALKIGRTTAHKMVKKNPQIPRYYIASRLPKYKLEEVKKLIDEGKLKH